MKLPAIQFYPADWRKDPGVQSLDYFDRGVWFEILCLMHESSERGKLMLNGEPMPDDALARVLGLDNQTLTKTLTTLLKYGVASRDEETGALMNRRMVKDEALRQIRTESGKKGGNPALLNQKRATIVKQKTTTPVNQKPTPSSSSSSSTTSSSTENEKQQRAVRLPVDFSISDSMRDWAKTDAPHVDLDKAFLEFVDYWRGVPGTRGTKLDWPATWRNRMRELEGRAPRNGHVLMSKAERSQQAVEAAIKKYGGQS